jgi:hypothetical protein
MKADPSLVCNQVCYRDSFRKPLCGLTGKRRLTARCPVQYDSGRLLSDGLLLINLNDTLRRFPVDESSILH